MKKEKRRVRIHLVNGRYKMTKNRTYNFWWLIVFYALVALEYFSKKFTAFKPSFGQWTLIILVVIAAFSYILKYSKTIALLLGYILAATYCIMFGLELAFLWVSIVLPFLTWVRFHEIKNTKKDE